ncbi:prolyl oligopeptidase family serine peptidase [Paenibacillus phytohabitans]|nr:prolyl oligopeptidase family serine peptidase [Paenibacillus phytohabitans]
MRTLVMLLLACSLLLSACDSRSGIAKVQTTGSGILDIIANSATYLSYSLIDSIIIEYSDDIELPDEAPGALYTFTDNNASREIAAVYTNNKLETREEKTSVAGSYVIVQLARIENPDPVSHAAWRPDSTAGRAVEWTGSHAALRMDYSGVELIQNYDARTADGQLVQADGPVMELTKDAIRWPEFEHFTIDAVLAGSDGDIHYSYYLPEDYDASREYPMILVLPGYDGLLLSTGESMRGVNVFSSRAVVAWTQLGEEMIVVSPQLTDWGETSARQTIELTEYFIGNFAVDPNRVYASGFSAGGETLSRVMGTRADLYAAYLHTSSQWDGDYADVVDNRMPVYIFMGQNDEYYGSQKAVEAYDALRSRYIVAGLTESEVGKLVVLELPDNAYFNRLGIYNYHGGGQAVVNDDRILNWVLAQHQP